MIHHFQKNKQKNSPLIWEDMCTPVFTAALFTISRMWNQPKCSSTNEWIKKLWNIYMYEIYICEIYTHTHTHTTYTCTQWNTVLRSVASVVSDSLWPKDCRPQGSSVHGDSPGKNTGVGCHALPQGIFPTQGSNPGLWCLLHCRQVLYPLNLLESPMEHYLTIKKNKSLPFPPWMIWRVLY